MLPGTLGPVVGLKYTAESLDVQEDAVDHYFSTCHLASCIGWRYRLDFPLRQLARSVSRLWSAIATTDTDSELRTAARLNA